MPVTLDSIVANPCVQHRIIHSPARRLSEHSGHKTIVIAKYREGTERRTTRAQGLQSRLQVPDPQRARDKSGVVSVHTSARHLALRKVTKLQETAETFLTWDKANELELAMHKAAANPVGLMPG